MLDAFYFSGLQIRETEKLDLWTQTNLLSSTHKKELNTDQNISSETAAEAQKGNIFKKIKSFNPKIHLKTNDKTTSWQKYILDLAELKGLKRLKKSAKRPIFNFRGESELGGERRFVVDGLANNWECKELVQFAKASN